MSSSHELRRSRPSSLAGCGDREHSSGDLKDGSEIQDEGQYQSRVLFWKPSWDSAYSALTRL